VRVIVTDILGLADTASATASVANVAPQIAAFDGGTLLPGETYTAQGSFTDPGSDPWSATVDYGDGSGVQPLALAGTTFSLGHQYSTVAQFTVMVRVADDDAAGSRTQMVTVLAPVTAVENVIPFVEGLGAGSSLTAKLEAAAKQLERGRNDVAATQLEAFLNELTALVRSGHVNAADAAPAAAAIQRVIQSVNP
jgi:hypothetical protein